MKISKDHQSMLAFLRTHYLTVIATTDMIHPSPESALIAYVENDQLELFFQTNRHSRKAMNLQQNLHVSFVIGLDLNDLATLQYQGIARRLTDAEEIERCKQMFIDKKSPTASPKYLEHPDSIYFHVKPTWIGFIDYRGRKPKVIERKRFR